MDGGAMRPVWRYSGRAVGAAAGLLTALPLYRLSAQDSVRISEAQSVLAQLVETYGVSGTEGPVREAVKRLLPSWAKSETDTAGNLWVRVGQGSPVVVVIAHLDEIGFRVTGIRDDGAPAQLIALRSLDRAALKHQVIFIWSVREEIGLEGAAAAAAALGTTPRRVHAIDTFVSADSPIELPNFAVAPIGRGAVARALDNSSITPPAYVDSLVQVARARGVALQVGTTNGGNDGSEFTPYGVVDVPIGWPLRYSHSPAEVIDLKDVVSLADMIRAVAETW